MQSVGKSSLLHRIIEASFMNEYSATVGVDFRIVKVPVSNKQVNLQIWDTAGQEKYSALTTSYFQGSQGCIAVYDLQDQETLSKAEKYVHQALDFQINPECIYLIGNKSDQSQTGEEEGRNLANELNINYAVTSAKTGSGVN
ncbi:UNVERIFIED_CONTAM: hypothetical protein GTU68_012018 [Idotea baltica]|nr:hypothetical protein [Idotea baltica]